VRVKIWDARGRIVYSDEPRLIGARYELGSDEVETLREGDAKADLSDLSRPENRFERQFGPLFTGLVEILHVSSELEERDEHGLAPRQRQTQFQAALRLDW